MARNHQHNARYQRLRDTTTQVLQLPRRRMTEGKTVQVHLMGRTGAGKSSIIVSAGCFLNHHRCVQRGVHSPLAEVGAAGAQTHTLAFNGVHMGDGQGSALDLRFFDTAGAQGDAFSMIQKQATEGLIEPGKDIAEDTSVYRFWARSGFENQADVIVFVANVDTFLRQGLVALDNLREEGVNDLDQLIQMAFPRVSRFLDLDLFRPVRAYIRKYHRSWVRGLFYLLPSFTVALTKWDKVYHQYPQREEDLQKLMRRAEQHYNTNGFAQGSVFKLCSCNRDGYEGRVCIRDHPQFAQGMARFLQRVHALGRVHRDDLIRRHKV